MAKAALMTGIRRGRSEGVARRMWRSGAGVVIRSIANLFLIFNRSAGFLVPTHRAKDARWMGHPHCRYYALRMSGLEDSAVAEELHDVVMGEVEEDLEVGLAGAWEAGVDEEGGVGVELVGG